MSGANNPEEATGAKPAAEVAGSDWTRVRGPQRDQDRVLQSPTHVWLRRIPSAIHPKHLCRYYPRIANRLAVAWGDRVEVEEIFDDLLHDEALAKQYGIDLTAPPATPLNPKQEQQPA